MLLLQRNVIPEIITTSQSSFSATLPYKVHFLSHPSELEILLKNRSFDVGHFQLISEGSFDSNIFLRVRKLLPKIGITCHLPGMTCISGEYLEKGRKPCSGYGYRKCTECYVAYRYPFPTTLVKITSNSIVRKITPGLDIHSKITKYYNDCKQVFHEADFIFSLAEWYSRMLKEFGVQEDKIHQVPQILPNQHNLDALECEKLQNSTGNLSIIFLGRLAKEKGISTLLTAWMTAETRSLSLNFVGPMGLPEAERLKFLRFIEMHPNVSLMGPIKPEEVARILGRHDIVILPSLSEMSPLVVAEAKALGKNIIGSDAPGISELLDEKHDYIFTRNDSTQLSKIFNRINDRELKPPRNREIVDNSEIAATILRIYQN